MRFLDYVISPNGIPLLNSQDIETYAQRLINDYSPLCLKSLRAFDIQGFVRNVLGCRIAAVPLCCDGTISAQTFFRDTVLMLQDERGTHRTLVVANTVLINRDLLERPKQARFVLAHEAGHLLLHGDFYRDPPKGVTWEDEATLEHQADHFAQCIMMNAPVMESYWGGMQPYLDRVYSENTELANHYAEAVMANTYKLPRAVVGDRLRQLGLQRRERVLCK